MCARERGSLRLWRVTGGTLLPWMTWLRCGAGSLTAL